MINGYDYAGIDGNIVDFRKARTKGSFAIVRGSGVDRGVCFVDRTLARDRDMAHAHGFTFGSYMILAWNQHGPSPEDQVRTFIKAYGTRRVGEFPPWLDLEADSAAAVGHTHQSALDWAHRAYDALSRAYGVVGTYTSDRVWTDVFGGAAVSRLGDGPLWIKIPYPYKANRPPHPEAYHPPTHVPGPWWPASSPGYWIVQYQGDAKPVDGFSNTVDLNVFNTGGRVAGMLAKAGAASVMAFQLSHGLQPDSVVGPVTFAALAR